MQTLPPINTSRAGCFEPPPAASCRCCGIEPKTAGHTTCCSLETSVWSRRTGQTAAPPGRQQPSCQSAAPTLAEPRPQPCRTLSRGARQPASSCSCAEIYRRWGSHRNHESQEFPSAAAAPTPHHPRQQKQTGPPRAPGVRPTVCCSLRCHEPSVCRFKPTTRWLVWIVAPRLDISRNNNRGNDPKSTSVPAATRVAATSSRGFRFALSNGAQSAICAGSSEYCIPAKSGSSASTANRFRRYSMLASPVTKLMCGVWLMKDDGSGSSPAETRCAQYCRLTWNCSLIATALSALT